MFCASAPRRTNHALLFVCSSHRRRKQWYTPRWVCDPVTATERVWRRTLCLPLHVKHTTFLFLSCTSRKLVMLGIVITQAVSFTGAICINTKYTVPMFFYGKTQRIPYTGSCRNTPLATVRTRGKPVSNRILRVAYQAHRECPRMRIGRGIKSATTVTNILSRRRWFAA